MAKYPEETKNKNIMMLHTGRWEWNDETETVEFISSLPPEKPVLRNRRPTDINFEEILQKSEWLAEMYRVNNRGRQSTIKSLDPSLLKTYRSTVLENQGAFVSIDDVKQVAVSLLQENYSLPIPPCFLDLLKSQQLDEVLMALLCYLCCFFQYKSVENQPEALIVLDIVTEHQMKARSSAKRDLALRRLAVCYFSLILDRDAGQKQHMCRTSSDRTEWLLEGVLYSFFCYVSWVAFGRKDLKEIQDEIGRILYSNNFNAAVKPKEDVPSRRTSTVSNISESKAGIQHVAPGCHSALSIRSRSSLRSVVNEKSPLMVSLLPSAREQSPHLFLGPKAMLENIAQTEPRHSQAQTEELRQELSNMSLGILGQPLKHFDPATLAHDDQRADKERDKASVSEGQNSEP